MRSSSRHATGRLRPADQGPPVQPRGDTRAVMESAPCTKAALRETEALTESLVHSFGLGGVLLHRLAAYGRQAAWS
jgi:hypothetical protein